VSGDAADVLRRALAWVGEGRGVAVAAVVSTWGSAPRGPGSLLVADDRGAFEGSVSGGCVEAAVVAEARAAIRDGRPRTVEYGVTNERAWEVGLACGGTLRVHVVRLDAPAVGALAALLADVDARRPAALAIPLAGGAPALLRPGEAGAAGDPAVLAAAREALEAGVAAALETAAGAVLVTPFAPPARVVAVGAVHVAQALVRLLPLAGLAPILVDPRPAFASEARFEGVTIVRAWPEEALARVGLDGRTAVVTLSHDPKIDDPALAAALRSEAFYVGALGSRRTHAARRERLRAEGFGDEALARIHAPVGLDLGGRAPGEIALAIAAELVAALHGKATAAR
jgi:xanthine dehydrogenase accessory factor